MYRDKISLILGCCNSFNGEDDESISPHDIGCLASSIVGRMLRLEHRMSGIKEGINRSISAIRGLRPSIIFLDDVHMSIGRYKIMKLRQYKRGHNAVKSLMVSHMKMPSDLVLLGARPHGFERFDLDEVNRAYHPNDLRMARVSCIAMARGLAFGKNRSHAIQVASEFFRKFF